MLVVFRPLFSTWVHLTNTNHAVPVPLVSWCDPRLLGGHEGWHRRRQARRRCRQPVSSSTPAGLIYCFHQKSSDPKRKLLLVKSFCSSHYAGLLFLLNIAQFSSGDKLFLCLYRIKIAYSHCSSFNPFLIFFNCSWTFLLLLQVTTVLDASRQLGSGVVFVYLA